MIVIITMTITILSMFFTIISVLLSSFEYIFSNNKNNESIMIIKFSIESQTIASMNYHNFQSMIVFKKVKINYEMSKLLQINAYEIDRLKPLQYKSGVMLTFIIQTDCTNCQSIKSKLHDCNDLIEVCTCTMIYQYIYSCTIIHLSRMCMYLFTDIANQENIWFFTKMSMLYRKEITINC